MKVLFPLSLLLPHHLRLTAAQEFRGCEYPALEWVTMSKGFATVFITRDAHVLGNHLVVVGELDVSRDVPDNYQLIGPITPDEISGAMVPKTLSKQIEVDDIEPEGEINAPTFLFSRTDIGINVIDIRTGEPVEALTLSNAYGLTLTNTVGAAQTSSGEDRVALGGMFRGQMHFNSTNFCNPLSLNVEGPTRYFVDCSDGTRLSSGFAPEMDAKQFSSGNWMSSEIGGTAFLTSITINQDATTENGNWIVDYNWAKLPWTGTFESEVSSVTVTSQGDVFAGGKACFGEAVEPIVANCVARIGKYAAADGATQWDATLPQFSDIYGVEYDEANEMLFFTGFHGPDDDAGDPVTCPDSTVGCQVIGAINTFNGDILWLRSLNNERNLGTFQNGEVKLAHEADGPYIYTTLSVQSASESLDTGTPYAACRRVDGSYIPDYEVVQDRFITKAHCESDGHTFVPSTSTEAVQPQTVPSGVTCTANGFFTQGCTMKLHKFTGRPIWATSKVQPRAMEASAAGPIISGSYRVSRGDFDGVKMRDLNKNAAFQALLDKDTGKGVYVQHFYDYEQHFHGNAAAIDDEGNYYIAARSNPSRLLDGDKLDLSLPKPGAFDSAMVVLKLDTKPGGATRSPSCLTCENNVATSVRPGFCFVDEVCFADGETGNNKYGDGSIICNAEQSQTALEDFGGEQDSSICDICGENREVTKPDALFDASTFGGPTLDCSMLSNLGLTGQLELDALGLTCSDAQNLVGELCGCAPKPTTAPTAAPVMPTAAPIAPTITTTVDEDVATGAASVESNDDGLSAGAIIGITVAGVAVSLIFAGLVVRQKLAVDVHVKRKPDESDVANAEGGADAVVDAHETDSSMVESSATDHA